VCVFLTFFVCRQDDISAGDDLIFYLQDQPHSEYTLSHHPKSYKKHSFPPLNKWHVPKALVDPDCKSVSDEASFAFHSMFSALEQFNLFPDNPTNAATPEMAMMAAMEKLDTSKFVDLATESMQKSRKNDPDVKKFLNAWMQFSEADKIRSKAETRAAVGTAAVRESIFQLVPGVTSSPSVQVRQAVWKRGYWHIARSQIMQFKFDGHVSICNGAHTLTNGKLLEATFEPVWVQPLEASSACGVTATSFPAGESPEVIFSLC
jgi:thioesterase domain-containing protein